MSWSRRPHRRGYINALLSSKSKLRHSYDVQLTLSRIGQQALPGHDVQRFAHAERKVRDHRGQGRDRPGALRRDPQHRQRGRPLPGTVIG